ncbi:hypothetical protein Mapa_001560 [Marchantia paleacea]|nr:hypothetical protein Mapa_001560 [Marchantia paleacea]
MALMEAISVGNVAKGTIGSVCPAVLSSVPSCLCASVDCRVRAFNSTRTEWTSLTLDHGRAVGIDGRKALLARRGPPRPHGLESKRSVQQEERKEDSEGSPGISSGSDGDLAGEVVDAEFQSENATAAAKTDEKPTTASSPDEIGKALSELRKERAASEVQGPASTNDFWQGVVDETKLIEWPVLPKVLGTTGVVVAMILGSSVVLLTVNAILAEGSDFLFTNPAFKEFAKGTLNLYW